MSMEDWEITKLDYLLLGIIIVLALSLLLITYAAKTDQESLKHAFEDCKQRLVYCSEGKLPLFQNISIKGDLIEIDTSTKR